MIFASMGNDANWWKRRVLRDYLWVAAVTALFLVAGKIIFFLIILPDQRHQRQTVLSFVKSEVIADPNISWQGTAPTSFDYARGTRGQDYITIPVITSLASSSSGTLFVRCEGPGCAYPNFRRSPCRQDFTCWEWEEEVSKLPNPVSQALFRVAAFERVFLNWRDNALLAIYLGPLVPFLLSRGHPFLLVIYMWNVTVSMGLGYFLLRKKGIGKQRMASTVCYFLVATMTSWGLALLAPST